MVEVCPKCGGKPKCGWLYNILGVGKDTMVCTKLSLELAHKLHNIINKEFQGNANAATRKAWELLIKHYGRTAKPPHVRNATLGWECSKCGYVWKMGEGVKHE